MSFSDMTGKMLNNIHLHKSRHKTQLHPMFLLKDILVFSTHIHQVGPEIHLVQTRRLCPTTIYRLHHPLSLCQGYTTCPLEVCRKLKTKKTYRSLALKKPELRKMQSNLREGRVTICSYNHGIKLTITEPYAESLNVITK
jgi:hypothetical protein